MLYRIFLDMTSVDLDRLFNVKKDDVDFLIENQVLYCYTQQQKAYIKKILKKAGCVESVVTDISGYYKNESMFVVNWYNSHRILEPLSEESAQVADEFYNCAAQVLRALDSGGMVLQPVKHDTNLEDEQ